MSREEIETTVINLIKTMTEDWDMDFEGEIGLETRLIEDLSFASIDVVQLVLQVETNYNRKDLPFETLLMNDGEYVDDLKLSQVVDFLEKHL